MAAPKADRPLHDGASAAVRRCSQEAEGAKKNAPAPMAAIASTFASVKQNCTRPPKATCRQLIADRNRMTATATICCEPNVHTIFCPRNSNEWRAQTASRSEEHTSELQSLRHL